MDNFTTENIVKYIQKNAASFYPELALDDVQLNMIEAVTRKTSSIIRISLTFGNNSRQIFVKVLSPVGTIQQTEELHAVNQKPRLYPRTPPVLMPKLEASALEAIYAHFQDQWENKLGAVRILGYLPDEQALILEEFDSTDLRTQLLKSSRICPFRKDFATSGTFIKAGQWLKHFHEMPKYEDVQTRMSAKADFRTAADNLFQYFHEILPDFWQLQEIEVDFQEFIESYLPEEFCLGIGHGDFAPRNVLVSEDGVLIVIDTFAKWRTAIYEDIGYFLNSLNSIGEQVVTLGLAFAKSQLKRYELNFLRGYFEDSVVPYREVKIFEFLAMLDKWASLIEARLSSDSSSNALKGWLINHHFTRRAKTLLKEIKDGRFG